MYPFWPLREPPSTKELNAKVGSVFSVVLRGSQSSPNYLLFQTMLPLKVEHILLSLFTDENTVILLIMGIYLSGMSRQKERLNKDLFLCHWTRMITSNALLKGKDLGLSDNCDTPSCDFNYITFSTVWFSFPCMQGNNTYLLCKDIVRIKRLFIECFILDVSIIIAPILLSHILTHRRNG